MALDFDGPASIVLDAYNRSVDNAEKAKKEMEGHQKAFQGSIYTPPVLSVRWETLPAPTLPEVPKLPAIPAVQFAMPGDQPTQLVGADMGDVSIDDFNVAPPQMNFAPAPVLNIGQVPILPTIRDVAVPDAPEVDLPAAPAFLSLTTHTFGGVDLGEGWLDKLDDIPELSIIEPKPFTYDRGPAYASQLLENLKATINARLRGGTGLNPVVEQALWDRARDRETQIALAREAEVKRSAESMGFPLPSGAMAGQLADARREYHDKLSGLSRDIAIKQAELEQENLRDAIAQGVQLEGQLLDNAYKLELLAFEAAKEFAANSIAAMNAGLERYKALLDGYRAYASAYDTLVRAEMSKVEVFKALLSAEQVKADINKSLVDRYKAEIDGRMAAVEIYKARVGAAQTLVQLEQARMQTAGEQVRAFVATINAETAKVDVYKAQVSAEASKQDAYRSLVQAYSSKASAQAEKARVQVERFRSLIAAKGLEWDGWKAKLSAESVRMESAARQSSIVLDGYRAGAAASETLAHSYMRRWEADIRQYEAAQNISLQQARINNDAMVNTNNARLEAAKIGLSTLAQQVASAWNVVNTSASISGSATMTMTQGT